MKAQINPYVTARGGVVIMNGPFPLPEAKRIASLCAAAPDLLEAAEWVLRICCDQLNYGNGRTARDMSLRSLQKAVAKAEREG